MKRGEDFQACWEENSAFSLDSLLLDTIMDHGATVPMKERNYGSILSV